MKAEILEKLPNTPMWVQYAAVKKGALDALLFYRMGDFYELFLEDAVEAAAILGITLTARNKGEEVPIPMCGVPFHSATNYINRLLAAGKRVAICEQMEEASAGKGIVKREIVRLVSPGMAFDPDALDAGQNNFLLALHPGQDFVSGCYCVADISTGSMEYTSFSSIEQLTDDLAIIRPKEILAPSSMLDTHQWNEMVKKIGSEFFQCVTAAPDFYFSPAQSFSDLCRHFNVLNLEGFGLTQDHPALASVGAVFRSIRDAQKQGDLNHLLPPSPRSREGFVQLDESTIEHLDLFPKPGQNPAESTYHQLNKTCTAMGARRLREILSRPLGNIEKIQERQDAVFELKENPTFLRKLRDELSGMRDVERLISKVGLRTAAPRDLQALQNIFSRLPILKAHLNSDAKSPLLLQIEKRIGHFKDLHNYLAVRLREDLPAHTREGEIFRAGWNAELDELISLTDDGRDILSKLEERERLSTGINSLKVKYNKVFGYFIEITNSNLANVPAHYIRKQTTANGERFLTDELKKFEDKILSAQDRRVRLEEALFQEAVERVGTESQAILSSARELSMLDAIGALAAAAIEFGYERPELLETQTLEIREGRHPALEHLVGRESFIANSVEFSANERVFLITGPNMAGKSTYMRQVALITLMAHAGSLVPAKSAKIGLVDRIATRVGASDRIGRGQSTFMVEMNEMARILRQSSAKTLVIIDEVGRGTSTFDGLALAWAILEDILDRVGCRTLFATHYHELTALEQKHPVLKNLCVAVEEQNGEVVFLHEVRRGKAPGSYGIEVARLAGLPVPVVDRAREVLGHLERGSAKLQKSQKDALQRPSQLSFFGNGSVASNPATSAPPEHLLRLEGNLTKVDIDHCTPMEALMLLKTWKQDLPPSTRPC